jgi:glycerol kinase
LRDQIGLAPDVPAIERLAIAAGDNGGVYLVPAFTGLGLPHWNSAVRAAIVGLSSHSDRRHLARAAFESIAFQLRDALDALRVEAQVQHAVLRADGGPTASEFLMQLCADIAGVELSVPDLADCSPYGAVLAGQLGQRRYRSLEEIAALGRAETVYRPEMSAEHVTALRTGWNRSVHQISG